MFLTENLVKLHKEIRKTNAHETAAFKHGEWLPTPNPFVQGWDAVNELSNTLLALYTVEEAAALIAEDINKANQMHDSF